MSVLIAARCVQALGGAFALVGCLELLVAATGERRGVARWIAAGVVGTAVGPVAGGLLTEAFSWQSIFIVQVPVAVLAVPAALAVRGNTVRSPRRDRPAIAPNVALALLSAALTAALFLLVLLLVDGWRRSPAIAALTVSVVPVAAFVARPLARRARRSPTVETAAGCLLVAGGLVGLALPPSAHLAWTIAPQALVGLGLGLTVDRLTLDAMRERCPAPARRLDDRCPARRSGARAGDPDPGVHRRPARRPGAGAGGHHRARARCPAARPGQDRARAGPGRSAAAERGRVPDLHPAFARLDLPPSEAGRRAARTRPRRSARACGDPRLPQLVPHRCRARAGRAGVPAAVRRRATG